MASQASIFTRTRALLHSLRDSAPCPVKSITTSAFLSQQPQLAESPGPDPPAPSTPLPPNPATGSPLYSSNWRNPIPASASASASASAQSLIPQGFLHQAASRMRSLSQTLDVQSLMNVFADWMTSQRWFDMKQLFEFWIRSLDRNGKPNRPDVNIYNHYLRANLMTGASAGDLLDLVAHMEEYSIEPNTASFNLVLKAMYEAREAEAAEKLLERLELFIPVDVD